jgi:signal transduction histidine kinase
VLELSADGVVLESNLRLEEALGGELAGRPLGDVLDDTSQQKWEMILSGSDEPAAWPVELVFVAAGSLQLRAFMVVWGGTGAGRRLWLLEHEPSRRGEQLYEAMSELNSELVHTQRELARERRRMEQALNEARAAVAARDEVLAFVSHDLRNPLSTIHLAAELLLMPIAEERKAVQAQVIKRAASGMSRLIEDLLAVSEVEAGRLSLERESVLLDVLFEEVCGQLDNLAREKRQRFEWSVAPDVPTIHADRHRIVQVLSNLAGNAIKFTPDEGTISMQAERDGGEVLVAIRDTGVGIPEDELPRIFMRFWHAGRARRGGAGLGLAISKGIVEAHGGRIWVESVVDGGTTFFFTIPVGDAAKPGAPELPESPESPESSGSSGPPGPQGG